MNTSLKDTANDFETIVVRNGNFIPKKARIITFLSKGNNAP